MFFTKAKNVNGQMPTESELVSLDELYKAYRKILIRIANRILNNEPLAEEVAEEAIVRYIDKGYKCATLGEAGAVLKKICRNAAIDVLKSKRFRELPIDNAAYFSDEMTNIEAIIEEKETYREVAEIIVAQPKKLVELYRLKYIAGKTDAEIAAELGVSVSAVKKRHAKLKENVKKELEGRL